MPPKRVAAANVPVPDDDEEVRERVQVASVNLALTIAKNMGSDRYLKMTNYRHWSKTVRAVMDEVMVSEGDGAESVFEAVIEGDLELQDSLTGRAKRRFRRAEAFAQQLLQNTVTDTNVALIDDKRPQDAWAALRQHHLSQRAANKARIESTIKRCKLESFRSRGKTEEQALGEYLAKMTTLRNNYLTVGGKLDESEMFMSFLPVCRSRITPCTRSC